MLDYSRTRLEDIIVGTESINYSRGFLGLARRSLVWTAGRRRIMAMVTDVEGMKLDLLVALQAYQIRDGRTVIGMMKDYGVRSEATLRHLLGLFEGNMNM